MRGLLGGVWCGLLLASSATIASAQTATVRIEVRSDDGPVAGADVFVDGTTFKTGAQGVVVAMLPAGRAEVVVSKEGFRPVSVSFDLRANQQQLVPIVLTRGALLEEHVTVSATRTDQRIEDVPTRVDVVDAEEVQEQAIQKPSDVVNVFKEMGGLNVVNSSSSLGAASVRIQGMRGRYTRFFSDGLPLFGDHPDGLALVQIPPMDLGQVEVIKGVSSAMYGAGAMGGVVNLVARRPTARSEEFLVNRTSRAGTDAIGYVSAPLQHGWGATLLAGGHWQDQHDINGDGWADLAGYTRGELRPRFFWDNRQGSSLFVAAGATLEARRAGTTTGSVLPAIGAPYRETLDTNRYDVGVVGQTLWANTYVLAVRASGTWQSHHHTFGDALERDTHDTCFGEVSARRTLGPQTLVIGAALDRDAFAPRDVPRFAYTFTTPGLFVQDDVVVSRWLSLSGGARVDVHSEYGTFFSPRVSALFRQGRWSSRVSAGTGFFPTSALTDETESTQLSRLTIRGPLRAEIGQSASADLTRTAGALSVTASVFASRIKHPVFVDRTDAYVLANQPLDATNIGAELLATWRKEPISLTFVYDFIRAREYEDTAFQDVPLTPRHAVTILGGWEDEDEGRFVLEWFYTGQQRLEANPFGSASPGYMQIGLLAEKVFGKLHLFVNAEDLNNVRQTQFDPLVRPSQGVDGRWTVDGWAPIEGRIVNGGIRVTF